MKNFSSTAQENLWTTSALVFLFIYSAIVCMAPIWDTDIWWHLKVGEWIVQNLHFPTTDLFSSIYPDREWKTFNWLFEVLFYGVHQAVGLLGVRILGATVVISGFGLWYVYFLRTTKNSLLSIVLLLLLMILFAYRIRIRPHIFNLPFEALIALFIQSGGELKTWKQRILFFIAGLTWSNIHNPCAAVGAAIISCSSLFGFVLDTKLRKYDYIFWPIFLSILAVFCNPYGPSLLISGWNNITPVHSVLGEWTPPLVYLRSANTLIDYVSIHLPLLIVGIFIMLFFQRLQRSTKNKFQWLAECRGPLFFLIVSQTAMRFVYLCTPMLAWMSQNVKVQTKKSKRFFVIAALVLFGILFKYQVIDQGGPLKVVRNVGVNIASGWDVRFIASVIKDAKLEGKVFTPVSIGAYILWFGDPSGGISADGRNNMSMDTTEFQNQVYQAIMIDGKKLSEALTHQGMDIAVLPLHSFPFDHWNNNEWMRVAYNDSAEIFLRTQSHDRIKIATFFHLPFNATPNEIEKAATLFSGEHYYQFKKHRMDALQNKSDEESVHELAQHLRISNLKNESIQVLATHLKQNPGCIRAATEIADILHDQGHYREALNLLAPATQMLNIPAPTQRLLLHLQSHKL